MKAARSGSWGRTLVSGALIGISVQLTLYALGFVASIAIARAVGPTGRGEYAIVVTAATICLTIMDLSLTVAHMYFFAERKYTLTQLSRNAAGLALGLAPVAIACLAIIFALSRHSVFKAADWTDFALVVAAVPAQLHQAWLIGFFVLSQRFGQSQIALLAGAMVATLGTVVLYAAGDLTVHLFLVLYLTSVLISWVLHVALARSFVSVKPQLELSALRDVLRFAFKLHPSYLVWFLLLRFDTFLVNGYLGTAAVGTYALAVSFGELVWMISSPVAMAAMPFQSAVGTEEAIPLTFKTTRLNVIVGVGLSLAFASCLWLAIPILYGRAFKGAYLAFVLLLPGVVAMAMERPLNNWLVRQGKPLVLTSLSFGAFGLNVVLCVFLLPIWGVAGASVASSVAYLALAAAMVRWGTRVGNVPLRHAIWPQREDITTVVRILRRLDPRGWRAGYVG